MHRQRLNPEIQLDPQTTGQQFGFEFEDDVTPEQLEATLNFFTIASSRDIECVHKVMEVADSRKTVDITDVELHNAYCFYRDSDAAAGAFWFSDEIEDALGKDEEHMRLVAGVRKGSDPYEALAEVRRSRVLFYLRHTRQA